MVLERFRNGGLLGYGLFDESWYWHQIEGAGLDHPLNTSRQRSFTHYLNKLKLLGSNSTSIRSKQRCEIEDSEPTSTKLRAYIHYIVYGLSEGRSPHPLFDPHYYLTQSPSITSSAKALVNPLAHFIMFGKGADRDPHPLFQMKWYLGHYPEIRNSGINPLVHYVKLGARSGLSPNEFFDPAYYLGQNSKVANDPCANANPLIHFLLKGAAQGLNPSPDFDSTWYLSTYPDVATAGVNPLVHFLTAGRAEGRETNGEFSARWFATQSAIENSHEASPISNYRWRSSAEGLENAKSVFAAKARQRLSHFLSSVQRISFQSSQNANVTVVIVIWNQAHFTMACLESLAASSVPVKVVVINNASEDETTELLARVDGIEIVQNQSNVGFVDAANAGLMSSTTDFTLFLNNDATLKKQTIEHSLKAIQDPLIGAVAARIILPNGLLQEAGSFLWRDGSAQGYLRGRPISVGEAMHAREVDFGSGAFLLLRTSVAQSLGGLEKAFSPAYGEEADLCLRMRRAGYRIMYDPRVIVEHAEFASSPNPATALALQKAHRTLLEERHREVLTERPSSDMNLTHQLSHWASKGLPTVLVLDDHIPFQAYGSGNSRAREVLREIDSVQCAPTMLVPTHEQPFWDWDPVWAEFGTKIEIYPEHGAGGLARLLKQHAGRYKTLWVSRHHNLRALLAIQDKFPDLFAEVPLVYDAEAITTLRDVQLGALKGKPWTQESIEVAVRTEMEAALRANVILAVNSLEADIFRAHGATNVRVLGHSLNVRLDSPGFEERSGIVFVGRLLEENSPNVDGLRWFFKEVWPLWVEGTRPSFTIVGPISPSLGQEFTLPGARLVGAVDKMEPHLNGARVFVAPTRFGAGVPIKIYDAAASGIPVVTTPLLAKQLGWEADCDLLVAHDPKEFAHAINELLHLKAKWHSVRESAMNRIRKDCDPNQFRKVIRQVLYETSESH